MSVALAIAAGLVAALGLRALRRWLPANWPRVPRSPVVAGGVAGDLERIGRTVAGASYAGEMHWRLRPVLREVAAVGVQRWGIDLDNDPDAARALLAPETWEIVRPDRPRPDDPFAHGLAHEELRDVVADLERVFA